MATNPFAKYVAPAGDPIIAPADPYKQGAEHRADADQQIQADNAARQTAADTWTLLPAEEVQQRGLNPKKIYQVNGLGNFKEVGDAPAGAAADPIEATNKLVGVIDAIDKAYADSADNSGWFETGFTGSLLRDQGGTAAYDLAGKLKKIDATSAFDALQKMREASPTGGALGSITEQELALLKSTVANLDPNLSQDEFIEQLGVAKGVYLDMLKRVDPAKADEILNRGQRQTDASGVTTYDDRGREALGVGGNDPAGPPNGGSPSGMDKLATASMVDLKGAAKAVTGLWDFGMDAASAVRRGANYAVGRGGEVLLDAAGAPEAADWWRRGSDMTEQRLATAPTASSALDRIYATPKGYEAGEFASSIVAGLALPGPKVAARPAVAPALGGPTVAREVIDAGKDAGIRVMTSDVRRPTTFTGKVTRATAERIPYAGTAGPRAAQQQERVDAIKEVAKDFGADVAGSYLDDIAADLTKTRGAQLTALKKAKDAVIDGVQSPIPPVALLRTLEAIDAQTRRLASIDAEAYKPIIDKLTSFGANIASGKTLREVEGNRKLLGDLFSDPSLAAIKGDGQKAVNAIYAPLRDDMGEFIKQASGRDAYSQWAAANKRLAAMAGELDSTAFKGVLSKADTTPEQVSRLLFNKQPSEVRRLYSNLSPAGQAKARAGIIHMAIEKAGGIDEISPDKFANAISGASKAAGVVFEGTDLARLRGLERVLQATKQASVASAAPPTGVQNSQMGMGYIAGASGPISIPILASYGGMARLYESRAVRDLLVGLSKTKPGTKPEAHWLDRIAKTIAAQTELRTDQLGRAVNDNVGVSAAAGNTQEQ